MEFSALLLHLLGNSMTGLPEKTNGHWWNHVPALSAPKENWGYEQVDDANKECSSIFGETPGKKFNGCVGWYQADPMEDVGIYPRIITGKNPTPALLQHEERHAEGWLHPSSSLLKALINRGAFAGSERP